MERTVNRAVNSTVICIAGVALSLLSALALAQYKYVGPDGKVVYSDQPPPANTKGVQKTNISGNAGPSTATLPFALQAPARNFPVTLYTAGGCEFCTTARAHLNKRGIPFTEKTITTTEDNAAFKAATSANSLPVMLLGNGKQVGFDGDIWDAALNAAGYPTTNQLPPGYKQTPPTSAAPEKPAAADAKKADATTAAGGSSAPPAPPASAPAGERPAWFKGF